MVSIAKSKRGTANPLPSAAPLFANSDEPKITSDETIESSDDEDDEEVNKLVQSSLKLLRKPSYEMPVSGSFEVLNKKIMTSDALSSSSSTRKSESTLSARQLQSSIYDTSSILAPPLKKQKVKAPITSGKGWFDIQPIKIDDSLQRDIKMIEMRNYIDPKRFYKKSEKLGQILHVGTVVEGPHEYKSSRLKNSERKLTIVDEMLADKSISGYSKKAFMEIQAEKMNRQKIHKRNKKPVSSSLYKHKNKINKLF